MPPRPDEPKREDFSLRTRIRGQAYGIAKEYHRYANFCPQIKLCEHGQRTSNTKRRQEERCYFKIHFIFSHHLVLCYTA